PVYSRAALGTLAGASVQSLALADSLRDVALGIAPQAASNVGRLDRGWVGVVFAPGGPVLARFVVVGAAHAGLLAAGMLVVRAGLLRRQPTLRWAGLAVQAQAVLSAIAAPPTLEDLESTGLSFAINVVAPSLTDRSIALSDLAAGVPEVVVRLAL